MTRRSYVQVDGVLYEKGTEPVENHAPLVIPDFAPFKDTTGTVIRGRAHWREHVRAHGGEEMGHSDIRSQQASHAKRTEAYRERMGKATAAAQPVSGVDIMGARRESPRIAQAVANRLHDRPTPDRKTIIKIALEEARRQRR